MMIMFRIRGASDADSVDLWRPPPVPLTQRGRNMFYTGAHGIDKTALSAAP